MSGISPKKSQKLMLGESGQAGGLCAKPGSRYMGKDQQIRWIRESFSEGASREM